MTSGIDPAWLAPAVRWRGAERARFLAALLLLFPGAWACDVSGSPGAGESSPVPEELADVPGEIAPPADNRFDAGRLQVGDRLLGLTVTSVDVRPAAPPNTGYTGTVEFRGEVTVSGRYRAHPDYPEPGADWICLFVNAETAVRLPRFREDERYPWFCFTNRELAVRELGPPDSEGAATVTVDEYRTERQFTDAFDTARLVAVLSKDDSPTQIVQ